ncbi:MAG: hypothetical protein IJU68_05545 [Bacteroidales bacterium]|nr:hypothetical protein [Bacteroidales bacterium]
MRTLLLNQYLRGRDVAVDEVGAFLLGDGLDRQLKLHHLGGVVDAEDGVQEVYPEALGFALLIALAGPFLDEGLRCLFLGIG